MCNPGDKGSRGFEKFEDVVKHVAKENGIQETDKKNINDLIRIPKHADALKIFRCMFCPGEGLMFVGLSEEIFLEHITNTHGNKVARRKPEKLRRECRVCGEECATDTELDQHIDQQHIRPRLAPFAGFGPRVDSDESGSDSEDYRSSVVAQTQVRVPPPPPAWPRSSRAAPASWEEKTDQFIKSIGRIDQSAVSRRRKREDSSDEEMGDLRSSLEIVQRKRRCLEDSMKKVKKEKCLLCAEVHRAGQRMQEHLAAAHKENCFSCSKPSCGRLAWTKLEEATRHVLECRQVERESSEEMLKKEWINPPNTLECIICQYCQPAHMIVASSWDSLKTAWFEHMEQHEDQHRENMEVIKAHSSYGCRLCDRQVRSEEKIVEHVKKHRREFRRQSRTPRSVRGEERTGRGEAGPENGSSSRKKDSIGEICCKYCGLRWASEPEKAVLRQHREEHAEMITSTNECFQRECRACDFIISYSEFRAWQNHVKSHESETKFKSKENTDRIQCSYCTELLEEDVLKSHVKQNHVKDAFQCGNCPDIFPLKSLAMAHMEKEHRVSPSKAESLIVIPERLAAVSCLQCGWDCLGGGDREMGSHVRLKHGTTDTSRVQYFCRLCGKNKAFRDQRRLEEHLRDHEGQTRARKDSREERADRNRNSIRNINNHLTSGCSGEDWRQRRRDDIGDRQGRRDVDDQARTSREEDRDRGYARRSWEENPGRREGGPGRGGRGGSRGVRGGGFSRGGRGGFSRGGGRGWGGRGGRGGGFQDRGRHQEKGEDWRCGTCGFQNFADRIECRKCKNAKSNVPQPPQNNAIEDTRNEIEQMMQQLQERAAVSSVIHDILEEAIGLAVSESEGSPPVSSSETPESPVYQPPEDEEEDEDESMGSAGVRESVSYECTECQRRGDNIYEIMMHLEEDHGLPDDEEMLMMKVREIKTKNSAETETSKKPDSTTVVSDQENNNENM